MTLQLATLSIGNWAGFAACRDADPALFFPDDAGDAEPAKTICAACHVQEACRTYARTAREPAGVWGGETEPERSKHRAAGPFSIICGECQEAFEAPDRRRKLCSDQCREARRRKTIAASNRRRGQAA